LRGRFPHAEGYMKFTMAKQIIEVFGQELSSGEQAGSNPGLAARKSRTYVKSWVLCYVRFLTLLIVFNIIFFKIGSQIGKS